MAKEYFTVSLDFDGVLAQGLKVKLKYAKKWFGVNLALHQTKKEGFETLMTQLGKKVNYRDLMDPLNEKHIMEYKVPPGCINALSTLYAQNCRFVIISSRNDHDYPYAIQFIKEKYDNLIIYIHNTRNESKGKFINRLKPRIHVDDDLSKLTQLLNHPVELIYYRQPENAGQEIRIAHQNRIWEAQSFADVKIIIEGIKTLHEAICWQEKIANKWTNIAQIFAIARSLSRGQTGKLLEQYKSAA